MQGTWAVAAVPSKYSTILEAMQRNVGERATIRYAKGSNFMYDEKFEERTWVNKGELPHLDDEQLLKEALENRQLVGYHYSYFRRTGRVERRKQLPY